MSGAAFYKGDYMFKWMVPDPPPTVWADGGATMTAKILRLQKRDSGRRYVPIKPEHLRFGPIVEVSAPGRRVDFTSPKQLRRWVDWFEVVYAYMYHDHLEEDQDGVLNRHGRCHNDECSLTVENIELALVLASKPAAVVCLRTVYMRFPPTDRRRFMYQVRTPYVAKSLESAYAFSDRRRRIGVDREYQCSGVHLVYTGATASLVFNRDVVRLSRSGVYDLHDTADTIIGVWETQKKKEDSGE